MLFHCLRHLHEQHAQIINLDNIELNRIRFKVIHFSNYVQINAMFGFSTIPFIKIFGTWNFGKRHFSTDISSTGHFGACKFGPCGHTGTWTFHLHGCFDARTFRHRDILTQGIFGTMDISPWDILAPEDFRTWMFFRLGKQYGHFGRDIVAPVRLCRNANVPKFSCA